MRKVSAGKSGSVANQITGGIFFQTVVQGKNITVHLPPQVTPALSGLPPVSSTFVGREQQVKELLESVCKAEPQHANLVAVAGLPGVGKTELVVQTAVRALEEPDLFPGGVLFVDMFGYDNVRCMSSERALESMLVALGVPAEHIPERLQDRSRLYRSVLGAFAEQGRRILLVIDNVSSAGQVRPLLPSHGTSAALLTSRHTLDVDARLYDLPILDSEAAVELLHSILQRSRGVGDTRVRDEPLQAATVARLCGGLPLALHIAGALLADTPARPVASLAEALSIAHTRLDRLRREDRAIRAAFDLSYQHLEDVQARIFHLLPVNPGPDLSTETVAHLAAVAEVRAEELLQDLARAHLVETGNTWGRWRLHDLVRLYADEQGTARAGEDRRDDALARLVRHYEATTIAADTHLPGSYFTPSARFANRQHALEWLDTEHHNLVAAATATVAFAHTVATAPTSPRSNSFRHPAIAIAQTPGAALFRYLHYRRYFDDLLTVSTAALATCRNSHDRRGEAMALNGLGVVHREMRRFEKAINMHMESVAICKQAGDRHGEAMSLTYLAIGLIEARRPGKAAKELNRSARLFARLGDRMGESMAYTASGLALGQMRRFEEAIDAHNRAVAVAAEVGDRSGEGTALNNLGVALRYREKFEEAIDAHRRAIAAFSEDGRSYDLAGAQTNLGSALHEAGKFKKAVDAHTRSRTLFAELGEGRGEAEALDNLGIALCDVGQFKKAIDAHVRARALFVETGDRRGEGLALTNLGGALCQTGRFEEAIDAYALSAAAFAEVGDRHGEHHVVRNLDLVYRRRAAAGAAKSANSATNSQATAIARRFGIAWLVRRMFTKR